VLRLLLGFLSQLLLLGFLSRIKLRLLLRVLQRVLVWLLLTVVVRCWCLLVLPQPRRKCWCVGAAACPTLLLLDNGHGVITGYTSDDGCRGRAYNLQFIPKT
jgi:hypothetical protein